MQMRPLRMQLRSNGNQALDKIIEWWTKIVEEKISKKYIFLFKNV